MRIDGGNNIHILYQNEDGELCYTYGTYSGGGFSFKAPEIVDTTGSMTYGSISIKETSAGVYVPVATYLNKAGTAQGIKYAYRNSAPSGTSTASADNWDYMVIPAISDSSHYPVNENRISLEGRKTGWSSTTATYLKNGGAQATATATPATVQAVVAFKSKQFETAYLKTSSGDQPQ